MTKPTKWLCAQRRLRPDWAVWSESSLSAWRKLGSLATHWVHSEDWSDWADTQADLSLRWAHSHFVVFVMRRLKYCEIDKYQNSSLQAVLFLLFITQVEVLQAEVAALKQLVLTSTPSSPNKHLNPQIDSNGDEKKKDKKSKPFWKTHRRSTSHHQFTREDRLQVEAHSEARNDRCKEVRIKIVYWWNAEMTITHQDLWLGN